MKKIIRNSIIGIVLGAPLFISGGNLLSQNFNTDFQTEEIKTNNFSTPSSKASGDYNYADDAEIRLHDPSRPSFIGTEDASFIFEIFAESIIGGANQISTYSNKIDWLSLRIEKTDNEYADGFYEEFKIQGSQIPEYFEIEESESQENFGILKLKKDKAILLGEGKDSGSDPFIPGENEGYQYRLEWQDKDIGMVQYTSPQTFVNGFEVPDFSFSTFEGYEQAVVRMRISFSKTLSDYITGDDLSPIFTELKVSWDGVQNQEMSNIETENGNNFIKIINEDTEGKKTFDFYLLHENLNDKQDYDVNVNFKLNSDLGSNVDRFENSYTFEFNSNKYELPTAELSDPEVIKYEASEEYNTFGNVVIDTKLNWRDVSFPSDWDIDWAKISEDHKGASFSSEIEYQEVIKSLEINEITDASGNVILNEGDFNVEEINSGKFPQWDAWSQEITLKNLGLGKRYNVNFKINFEKPEIFGLEKDFITGDAKFNTPDSISEPSIEITGLEIPKDESELQDPTNWTQMSVTYEVNEPTDGSWTTAPIGVDDVFKDLKIMAYNLDGTVAVSQDIEPDSITSSDDNIVLVEGLDSATVYDFKIVGTYTNAFKRIFGFDGVEGDVQLESNKISSETRLKELPPTITTNTSYHNEFETDEEDFSTFTFGFDVTSPLGDSWVFNNENLSSAFHKDNIIKSATIENLTSLDTDIDSSGVSVDEQIYYSEGEELKPMEDGKVSIEKTNLIRINNLAANNVYTGDLVINLTEEASNSASGWIENENGKIITKINFLTGHALAAPKIFINSFKTYQNPDSYNKHIAELSLKFDITDTADNEEEWLSILDGGETGDEETPDLFTSVSLKHNGFLVSPSSSFELNRAFFENTDPSVGPVLSYTEDAGSRYYSTTFTFDNLDADTTFDLFINTTSNPLVIESLSDFTYSFKTGLNSSIENDSMTARISGFDSGMQNETINGFDQVQLELATSSTSFGGELAKNIDTIKLTDSTGKVIDSFDKSDILTLNADTSISKVLGRSLEADTTYDLSKYKLEFKNNTDTYEGFEITLAELTGDTEIHTGKLNSPEINSFNIAAYTDLIKVNWDVTNLNNIQSAKITLFEGEEGKGYDDTIIDTETFTEVASKTYGADSSDSTFDLETDQDWEDSVNYTDIKSATRYYAQIEVTPKDSCESTTVLTQESEKVPTGIKGVEAKFNIKSSTTINSINVEYDWSNNLNASIFIEKIKLNVVDVATSENIFWDTHDVNGISGKGSFVVNDDNVETGKNIFSNQDYELELTVTTKDGEEISISTLIENPDEYNSTVHTLEKNDNFNDNFKLDKGSLTEESFYFKYSWEGKTKDQEALKNVTDHSISIYEGEDIIEESKIGTFTINDESEGGVATPPTSTFEKPENLKDHWYVSNDENSDIDMSAFDEIGPNSKYSLVSDVTFDVYQNTYREFETRQSEPTIVSVTYPQTEIKTQSEFLDNDSIKIKTILTKDTAFNLYGSNKITFRIFDDDNHTTVSFAYDGISLNELTLTFNEIKDFDSYDIVGSENSSSFDIQLNGIQNFDNGKKLTIQTTLETTIGSNINEEPIKKDVDQSQYLNVNSDNFGVISRKEVSNKYIYEIKIETSPNSINSYGDMYISEINSWSEKSTDIKVVRDNVDYDLDKLFEYNQWNLYISADIAFIDGYDDDTTNNPQYNDLSFLVGRFFCVESQDFSKSATKTYDVFKINGFHWLYPPKTPWEITLEVFWIIFLIILILGIFTSLGFGGYYGYRYTFSNKRWYPIVEKITKEKFKEFTNYMDYFGWQEKFQEYEDLKEKSIEELREYAIKMNVPITFDMEQEELIDTLSLLTEDEISNFDNFIESDIDIRHYEVFNKWKEVKEESYHFWIKYKLSQLADKHIIADDDVRLRDLHSQLDYIEQEKKIHEEREEIFSEIKDLVGTVLDTNIELTSEFTLDPASEFKKSLKVKEAAKKKEEEKEQKILEQLQEKEAAKKAEKEAAQLAKQKSEEEKKLAKEKIEATKKAEKEAKEAENAEVNRKKEIENLHELLEQDFKKINVDIELFNKRANSKVDSLEEMRKLSDKLNKDRIYLKKETDEFKKRLNKLNELHDEKPVQFGLKTLKKVNVTKKVSKLDKFVDTLTSMTKQELFDVAKKYELEVKASWNKDKLREDIIKQLRDRGDF